MNVRVALLLAAGNLCVYAKHKDGCKHAGPGTQTCTCGFEDAQRELLRLIDAAGHERHERELGL